MKKNKVILIILLIAFVSVNSYILLTKKTVVNFYSHPDKLGFLNEAINEFESKHKNIDINMIELPDNTNEKYEIISSTLALKDGSIDVIDADVTWPSIFVNAGWVENIDTLLPEEERKDYLDSAISSATIDGNLYGIPYRIDSGMLYYRSDLLEKYGFKVPKTWNELIRISNYIIEKENNDKLYGYAGSWFKYEGLTCNYLEFLWSDGGTFIKDDHSLGSKKSAIKALTTMNDMIYKDKIAPPNVYDLKSGDLRKLFINGQLIFMRDWPTGWKYTNKDESLVKGKVKVSPLPYYDNYGKSHGTYGGWLYMISKYSTHKKESMEFIKFLTSYEQEKKNALLYNYLPSVKSLYEDEDILVKMPFINRMNGYFNEAKPRPRVYNYDIISYIIQDEVSNALKGTKDPKTSIDDMFLRINDLNEK
ncbi:ABC transporter substrate-binding protein [Helicovermis profundi]|uniref:ABC transporter substrate-binding protein n=1 Tax=Helicovermis profundi TaxID=3065157 RepID=A0AAU9EFU0_9FIRM|nr:ABC transporter substrate-binding protein [Clostridia bacterium S502]